MQSWQCWMSQGNSAYQQQQLSHAVYCYRQALSDVWPIWYHCAFVCCPAELSIEEATLPTHCFAVVLLNLAETYAKAGEWRLCQRTLAQGLFWFRRMLQQSNNGDVTIAVIQQQAALMAARARYQRQHQLSGLVKTATTETGAIHANHSQPEWAVNDFTRNELSVNDTSCNGNTNIVAAKMPLIH